VDILNSYLGDISAVGSLASISLQSSQVLFGLLILIIVLLWGFSLGRTRALVSLLSIYIALAVTQAFPYLEFLSNYTGDGIPEYWMRSAIFLTIYFAVFSILNHSFIKKRFAMVEFSVFGVLTISILQIGLLLSIFASFLTPELAERLLGGFQILFASQTALFWWSVLPVPMLLVLKEGR
jgi:hypothetical protein